METKRVMVFDVDGTLIDSNDAHAQAWVSVLATFGISVETAAVRRLIGMGGDKLLPALTSIAADSPRGKEISQRRGEVFRRDFLPKLQPFPQTRELFEALRSHHVRLTVASSAEKADLDQLLGTARVSDLVEQPASSDDAARSKPDPDIIHAALARLGNLDGATISMVGDTPYDVAAAMKAGIRPLAFRCGGWNDRDLTGAAIIFDAPADMLARVTEVLDGSE